MEKQKDNICNTISATKISNECDCNYIPPPVQKMLMRRLKNGQIQVKINNENWINAEYDEKEQVIRYTR